MATIELRVKGAGGDGPVRRVMTVERVPVAGDYVALGPRRLVRVEAVVFRPDATPTVVIGVHDGDDMVDELT